jgi:hypothetical protein
MDTAEEIGFCRPDEVERGVGCEISQFLRLGITLMILSGQSWKHTAGTTSSLPRPLDRRIAISFGTTSSSSV